MKLYTYFRSSASYRVRIALNLKAIDHTPVSIDLRDPSNPQRAPDFLSVNPQGLVPALIDGPGVLTQSLAIIEYLEETHPSPPLLPRSAWERAQVRSLALLVACDIHPLNNLRVLNYLRVQLDHRSDTVDAWYRHWVRIGFAALEEQAHRTSRDGLHLFENSVTLADVCMVPQMYNARRFGVDLSPYPTLRSVCAHLESLPAFSQASPERQTDAIGVSS